MIYQESIKESQQSLAAKEGELRKAREEIQRLKEMDALRRIKLSRKGLMGQYLIQTS